MALRFKLLVLVNAVLVAAAIAEAWRVQGTPPAVSHVDRRVSTRVARVDLLGKEQASAEFAGRYSTPRLLRHRKSAYLTRIGPGERSTWALDLSTFRITPVGRTDVLFELLSPGESSAVVFVTDKGRLYINSAGKPQREILFSDGKVAPLDWSHDGRWIVASDKIGAISKLELVGTETGESNTTVIDSHFAAPEARFSPDGKWIAFTSGRSGRDEVYLVPVALHSGLADEARLISHGGAHSPQWGPAVGELFYLNPQNELVLVKFGNPVGSPTEERKLFRFQSLDSSGFEYGAGGYCPDGAGGLLVVLNRVQQRKAGI
jgi:dipeptidyl aminopeptidase/acylaminoacyl peptidase